MSLGWSYTWGILPKIITAIADHCNCQTWCVNDPWTLSGNFLLWNVSYLYSFKILYQCNAAAENLQVPSHFTVNFS